MPQNNCDKYTDMIYEYTADMLSDDKALDLMRHIEHCTACRGELERIRAVMNAAAEIEDIPVPDELISALDTCLEQTAVEIKKSHRPGFGGVTGTVLSLAAAAALAIGMYSGGVFDKYLHSDDVFNNTPAYTDDRGTAQTEPPSDGGDAQNAEGSAASGSDTKTAAGGESVQSGGNNSNASDVSDKSDATDKSDKSHSSLSPSRTNSRSVSESERTAADANPNALNTAADNSASASTADNAAENTSSAKSAEEPYSVRSILENLNEGYGGADDYGISASSADSAGRSSGGGSAKSPDEDDCGTLMKQQSPVQTYSADTADSMPANSSNTNVPSSCEIVTANPQIYRDMYNVGSSGKFSISPGDWDAFRQFVSDNGDTLNVGGKTLSDPNARISVRITAK